MNTNYDFEIDFLREITMKEVFEMALLYNLKENINEPDVFKYLEKSILKLKSAYEKDASSFFSQISHHRKYEKCGKTCPYCGSYLFVVKKGFDKKGRQKYQCGNCKKNFTDLSQHCDKT